MFYKILSFTFLSFFAFYALEANASQIDFDKCQSIIIIHGMKIEFLAPKKFNVDPKTQEVILDKNFDIYGINYKSAGIVIKLTALEDDIKIQKELYTLGINSWFLYFDKKRGFFNPGPQPISKYLLSMHTLKKGDSIKVFRRLAYINYEAVYETSGNKVGGCTRLAYRVQSKNAFNTL